MPAFFSIIYAVGSEGEFSYKNKMPWPRLDGDLLHFKNITTSNSTRESPNVVIMGRNTWESIGKPLSKRHNIVISKTMSSIGSLEVKNSLQDALDAAGVLVDSKKASYIYLIGGASLIREGLAHPLVEYLYETRIISPLYIPCNNYLSSSYTDFKLISRSVDKEVVEDKTFHLTYSKWMAQRDNHPEQAYINLCLKVLNKGMIKSDRTGTGTISTFGEHLEFDLSMGFPLYTGKRVFFRGVVEELLFFLTGKTQTKVLEAKGIYIWKGNTSRAYLDSHGFNEYEEGEMGPGYGRQWRHFGASYTPNGQLELNTKESANGIDQIANVIRDIKAVMTDSKDCHGRRLLVSAWNPTDLDKMALPCCHYAFQFSVDEDRLNINIEMRSNDLLLGNPFNVTSYALLTYMIGYIVGLKPGKLTMNIGDCHLYLNAVDAMKEQLTRPPRPWPMLEIIGDPKSIDSFGMDNFKLVGYTPHPPLVKVSMAI